MPSPTSPPPQPELHPALADPASKPLVVQALFNQLAPHYDKLNDVISMGLHRRWKRQACLSLGLRTGQTALDVCTGTGDLAAILAECVGKQGEVIGVDFSHAMLGVATQRWQSKPNITFTQGDAMALPLEDASVNAAVMSFGLRNVANTQIALAELVRVVKPQGRIAILDTCPQPELPGFNWYFSVVMPKLGQWLSGQGEAYTYLNQSTQAFLTPQQVAQQLADCGLQQVKASKLAFGAAMLVTGQVP